MKIIKKLDIYILGKYLVLFAGTFCISLFVVMMQCIWRYIDELVGKGLTFDILAKFFFYAGESLVPLALPLGVLLASLISFGNLGEKFELLAIKASGVSLFRTMRPLIILNICIAAISFYFQNNVGPKAQEDLMTLRWSIMQSTPEVDIPEGVFYSGVPGLNMYVKHKENGKLYGMVLYNMRDGATNAQIILADSGKLETSADKKEMILHLFSGEEFQNISGNSGLNTKNVPYRRETFVYKSFLIDFDTNFNLKEEEGIGRSATTKSIEKIMASVDSMTARYDSMAVAYYNDMAVRTYYVPYSSRARVYPSTMSQSLFGAPQIPEAFAQNAEKVDSVKADSAKAGLVKNDSIKTANAKDVKKTKGPHLAKIPEMAPLQKDVEFDHKLKVNLDSLFEAMNGSQKQSVVLGALQKANIAQMDTDYKSQVMGDGDEQIRRHWIEVWTKVTMSLACIIFFFIGAPLGAIIRKGGLGMPAVIAVLIFIFYYIVNTGGMRAGRQGSIPVWFGMWLSTMIFTPVAVFLTIKSNNDSAMFNKDAYTNLFRKLTGKRVKRHLPRKEVIINDPDYPETLILVETLVEDAKHYRNMIRRASLSGYLKYMALHLLKQKKDDEAEKIHYLLEHVVDILSNSKDRKILVYINSLPVLETQSFRFYRRRRGDMRNIIQYGEDIGKRIKDIINGQSKIQ